MSVCQQSILNVTSSVIVTCSGASRLAQHNYSSENYFKVMFSFHCISVLLVSV